MLLNLSVKNYVLIKELNIDFGEGLTIVTGETGAGKSILLGALSLILGNRIDTAVLSDKKEKCIVEGTFNIKECHFETFFDDNDIDYDDIAIIRREINPAGKSRAFINDTPVTLGVLKTLGDKLIDIHSQHQTLLLHDNSFQLNIVDSFADTAAMRHDYHIAYNDLCKLRKDYEALKEKTAKDREDLDYYSFQLNQLDDAKLVEGEMEDLEREQELLTHAEDIKYRLGSAVSLLSESESASILSMLREVKNHLVDIRDLVDSGSELVSRVESAYIELDDIYSELDRRASSVEADPKRLERIGERLDLIYSLMQKHRASNVKELIAVREEFRSLVGSIITGDERLSELRHYVEEKHSVVAKMAEALSLKRKSAAGNVERHIEELLKQLGMPHARFEIAFRRAGDFTPGGIDIVDFLFSANKQVPLGNLTGAASGGELSRVMLSLKSVLSKNSNLPTIIFDEIDSGVSGEVADKVGQILENMGRYMQVINITHLPQVASRGTCHYHVYKDDSGASTVTKIKLLSRQERLYEIARLLSGSEITESALQNAKDLMADR